jgi:hypothetical protein
MIALSIIPDLEGKLKGDPEDCVEPVGLLVIGGLGRGTMEGNPVAVIAAKLPDGKTLVAQTSLKLFLTAADALKAKYGDPR